MSVFYRRNIGRLWLIGLIGFFQTIAYGDGNGLCNNSGGYRLLLNEFLENPDIIKNYPELVNKLKNDAPLSKYEQLVFVKNYARLVEKNALTLRELEVVRGQVLAGEGLGHSTIYSRNMSMAMDHIMSDGWEPDFSISFATVSKDAKENPNELMAALDYSTDIRTVSDLVQGGARDLRLNGNALSDAVIEVFRKYHFDNSSLSDMRRFLEAQLSREVVASLQETEPMAQALTHLDDLAVGDSALVSYNVKVVTVEQVEVPPRRFTVWVQRYTNDNYLMYTPASETIDVQGTSVWMVDKPMSPIDWRENIYNAQLQYFTHYTEAIRAASVGDRFEIDTALKLMEDACGVAGDLTINSIDFSDFWVITHRPHLP